MIFTINIESGPNFQYHVGMDNENKKIAFDVFIDINVPFSEIVTFNEGLMDILDFARMESDKTNKEMIENFCKRIEAKDQSVFEEIEPINIFGEPEEVLKYFQINPELKNKKVVLDYYLPVDKKELTEISATFKDYPNLYFRISGNNEPISLTDAFKTADMIDNIVAEIKKYDYSPLEQLIYAYDIIRNRVYTKSTNPYESRDLTSVLLGDKIVCVGYSNIFEKVVNKLGIRCIYCPFIEKGKLSGHARNLLYFKDDKYDINGVYYFDLTWDSKKSQTDQTYLSSYKYFAKTKGQMERYDQKYNLKDEHLPVYSNEFLERVLVYYNARGFEGIPDIYVKTINRLSKLIDDGMIKIPTEGQLKLLEILINKEELESTFKTDNFLLKLEEYTQLMNMPICNEKILRAITVVRENEYYKSLGMNEVDEETLYQILCKSGLYEQLDFITAFFYKDEETLKEHYRQIAKNIMDEKIKTKRIINSGNKTN